ncbi:MAG: sensor histidine kinase [Bacteroidales bacterium]|nr:sensor histidine kinase [Bacteroidales bacterium]
MEKVLITATDTNRAKILYSIASAQYNKYPDKCLKYVLETVDITSKFGLKALQARAFSIAGVIYKNKGDFETSLEYQLQALKIAEELGLKKTMASSYNDLGVLYKTLGEYDLAIENYKKSLKILEEFDYKYGTVMILNNIGTIYDAKNDNEKAMDYYNQALEISEKNNILQGKAISLNNIGELFIKKNNYSKALTYFFNTYEIDKKTGDKFGGIYTLLNIARTYNELKNYSNSIKYYKIALNDAEEQKAKLLISKIFYGLSATYEAMKKFDTALEYFKKFQLLNDSVFNEKKSEQFLEMQTKYETEKKEKEITFLTQEKEIHQLEISQQRNQILLLLLIVASVIVLSVFIYYRYRQKQKALLNAEIIKQKELRLKTVIETQEEERKRIAKDLHDGLGQILSGLKLTCQGLITSKKVKDEDNVSNLMEINKILDNACHEVRTISHQMMPRELNELGLIPSIEDMINNSLGNLQINVSFEHFGITDRFDEKIEIGLYRIAQELINNVIKHSQATNVNIQLYKNKGMLVFMVEDNGKGFQLEEIKDKGIGLLNINSRVDAINGELNYETGSGIGTVATIRVPI